MYSLYPFVSEFSDIDDIYALALCLGVLSKDRYRRCVMTQSLEHVYKKLEAMQVDLEDLRSTYKGVSKRYLVALSSLNTLTLHSSDAAKRAAKSTEQSRVAAMNAMIAAREASNNPALLQVVESAVTASVAAAASAAVAHQAEESLLKASNEAAIASRMAAESAAEAVKLSNQAREIVDGIHKKS